ncbi:MAG: leucine-rich repeat domain-containing protein [Firmicutes bacterium]|nr:leucine-rich repeat domain-containing protein [Bacillota bacterium]
MRKFIKIATALLFVSIFALAFAACNNPDNPDNDIEINCEEIFTTDGNTVTGLTEYGATLTKLTISNRILGYNITAIAQDAFKNNQTVTEVIIPNSAISIRNGAFEGCIGLTNVIFESDSKLTEIGGSAFYNCTGLTSISIPNSVTTIERSAFEGCTGLTAITIPFAGRTLNETNASYTHFGWIFGAQSNSNQNSFIPPSLNTVIIAGGDSIGQYAFEGCTGLTNVIFESDSKLTEIGDSAFWGCTGLTTIEIPSSVTIIGESAFWGCTGLTAITIPFVGNTLNGTSNTHFGWIFGAQSSVNQFIFIPSSLKTVIIAGGDSIGNSAFGGCRNLTSITIPNSVTSIGDGAFEHCRFLEAIEIPNLVTSIGQSAFANCTNLTSIVIPNLVTSIRNNTFSDSGLTNVIFESKLTSIGRYAFSRCRNLTSIEIPDSVTFIEELAFWESDNLTDIYVQGHLSPPDGWHIDWNAGTTATIHWGQ